MEEMTNMILRKIGSTAGLLSESNQIKPRPEVTNYVQKIVSGKAKAEKAVVKQILEEILAREAISQDIKSRIESDILQCSNSLHEINSITENQYLIDKDNLRFSARKTQLDMKILDLEAEKRTEQVNAWKDISTLRRYLLFGLKNYWDAVRRAELISLKDEIEPE